MGFDLDLQQLEAVRSPHQDTMVIASAGSGKTRCLTGRVAYLVEEMRVSPTELLCLTFTRRASGEMVSRLEKQIGRRAHKLNIGTIHAMALKYIRMWGDKLGLRPSQVTVYSQWEAEFLLKDTALLVKAPAKYLATMEQFYQTGAEPAIGHPHRRLFDVYMARLRQNNALDYGMLLLGMKIILPEICSRPLSHVLVDEAQDLDELQWSLTLGIQALRPETGLFVVGDDWQCIYKFRGARPDLMIEHQKDFHVYRLETNYRSVPQIVEPSARLIKHNVNRTEKEMIPHRKDKGKTMVVMESDSKKTAAMLQGMLHTQPNIAVLSRVHVLLQKLSSELDELGVKHNYCGRRAKAMQGEDFRRVHAIFKLVFNPFDNFSFALARDILGVPDSTYLDVLRATSENGSTHLDNWLKSGSADAEWIDIFGGKSLDLTMLCDRIYFKLENFRAMPVAIARQFADGGKTLKQYLDWVATYDLQEEVVSDYEGLQLMTVHQAKGLEFPCVVLVGWNEGFLPSKQAVNAGEVEDERCVAFVGMTRAQDQLFICVRPEVTESNGKVYQNPVSRFIGEITQPLEG